MIRQAYARQWPQATLRALWPQPLFGDAIGEQRPVEFAYLRSEAFGALLAQHNMQVVQGPLHHLLR